MLAVSYFGDDNVVVIDIGVFFNPPPPTLFLFPIGLMQGFSHLSRDNTKFGKLTWNNPYGEHTRILYIKGNTIEAVVSSVQFSLLFCLCLTFDIYIYKEKINYILISIKNETTLRYIH